MVRIGESYTGQIGSAKGNGNLGTGRLTRRTSPDRKQIYLKNNGKRLERYKASHHNMDWEINQGDIKDAYLNGHLEELNQKALKAKQRESVI